MGAFFLLRINDHMQYLKKIKATLDGTGDFQGSDHHSCRLGTWIDGAGPREVAQVGPAATAIFNSVRASHEQFHVASGRALALQAAGRIAESQREMTAMHRLSSELVNRLLELDNLASGKR